MTIGMDYWVWYDDEPKNTLKFKIEQAVSRYQEKYRELPRECRFNQNMMAGLDNSADDLLLEEIQFTGVELSITDNIPRNNFWLGPVPFL
jgi:hypothetical protein